MAFSDPDRGKRQPQQQQQQHGRPSHQWRGPNHQKDEATSLYWSQHHTASTSAAAAAYAEHQHHSLPPMTSSSSSIPMNPYDNSEIYESIYDSRWRLMQKEAARLHREGHPSSATSSPHSNPRWSSPPSPLLQQQPQQQQLQQQLHQGNGSSTASSRESSLGPSVNQMQPAVVLSAKSPRSIVVRKRGDGGFGFTLRHFIVYPPEDGTVGDEDDDAFASLKEPMDTIFVKSVKEGGAAYHAGLRIGDRIVSVNGESVLEKSYARVVQLIKRSGDNLKLIVVPQEDDMLQRYFSEIAQNPETNQRPSASSTLTRSAAVGGQRLPTTSKHAHPSDDHVYAIPAFVRDDRGSFGSLRSDGASSSSSPQPTLPSDGGAKHKTPAPLYTSTPSATTNSSAADQSVLSRIRKETEMKEQFLRRPVVPQPNLSQALVTSQLQKVLSTPSHDSSNIMTSAAATAAASTTRRASDTLPPIPFVVGVPYLDPSQRGCANYATTAPEHVDSPEKEDACVPAAAAAVAQPDKCGLVLGSETPESHRKLAKSLESVEDKGRKGSLGAVSLDRRRLSSDGGGASAAGGGQRSSAVSSESESSRKSSMSSGRKRSLFHGGGGSRDSKQFAVTFFVNESEKTKLVDILHKAKNVISKKMEKVMGRKPKPASVSSAEALTSILETWVNQEEEKGKDEEEELQELIQKQAEQIKEMEKKGVDPPVNYVPVPTVVSPVPEEEEQESDDNNIIVVDHEGGEEVQSDVSVQEVIEGQDNYLRPPPHRFQLSRSSTPSLSPRRSLSPCNGVPRHFNVPDSELYPPSLRRPSSHYDESAQAASSRPVTPNQSASNAPSRRESLADASPAPSSRRGSLLASGASPAPSRRESVVTSVSSHTTTTTVIEKEDYYHEPGPIQSTFVPSLGGIQRPESMTVPIGGVWRPEDSDVETSLFPDDVVGEGDDEDEDAGGRETAYQQRRPTSSNGMSHFQAANEGGQSAASWLLIKYCDFSEMMIQQAWSIKDGSEERKDSSSSIVAASDIESDINKDSSQAFSTRTSDSRKSSAASSASASGMMTSSTYVQRSSPYTSSSSTAAAVQAQAASSANSHVQKSAVQKEVVRRRQQNRNHISQEEAEERNLRRISYLKATKDERLHQVEPDIDENVSTGIEHHQTALGAMTNNKKLASATNAAAEKHPPSIQKIRSLFGDRSDSPDERHQVMTYDNPDAVAAAAAIAESPMIVSSSGSTGNLAATAAEGEELKEGWLTCKVAAVEGKKANDRSWKQVYVILKSQAMFLYRDKKVALEHPLSCEEAPLSLSESQVEVADDYTKRKHVFRIRTDAGSEYLFQAEGENNMHEWIEAIEETSAALALVVVAAADKDASGLQGAAGKEGRGLKKLTSFRNRSPSAHSPAAKTRKASQDQGQYSKDAAKDKKTWKGKVAKQWKKMHHGSNPVVEMAAYPEGGSIGVPLEDCPMSGDLDPDLDRVPLLVSTCCSIVEERGLEIVGVYRVPGNSAAVSYLTEQVNTRGMESFRLDDPRWNDVNVVSSLLKSFFRKLPEPLFTNELYPFFIDACKIEDSSMRLSTLKKFILDLPECNYETLKFVCRHLTRVMAHSHVNKMEVRNLAIVFGPTLVRTADDNMLSMVTDMAQQCRIIESMLNNCEWFFNGEEPSVSPALALEDFSGRGSGITQTGNESLLLNNLQKLEEAGKVNSPAREVSAKDIVSGIISAANRKIQRSSGGKTSSTNTSAAAAAAAAQKRDSVDHAVGVEMSASMTRVQRLDTPTRCISASASRRNSESVIHGAMAIATAVPQLMGGKDCSSANSSVSSIPGKLASASDMLKPSGGGVVTASGGSQHFKHMSISAENISQQQQISLSVSMAPDQDVEEERKPSPFPIDTYTGLEEATAKRIKRFEEETMAMLARNQGAMMMRSASDTMSGSRQSLNGSWNYDLKGGILLLEPYQTEAYKDTAESSMAVHNRFVNREYLSPCLSSSTTTSADDAADSDSKLTRGVSLGNIIYPSDDATMQKHPGSHLKRHKFYKTNTEPQLLLPLMPEEQQQQQTRQVARRKGMQENECDDVLNSITSSFDEKLRLLLDPRYQSTSVSSSSTPPPPQPPLPTTTAGPYVSLSVHSTPSKQQHAPPRRTSEYTMPNSFKEREKLKLRSTSVGLGIQKMAVRDKNQSAQTSSSQYASSPGLPSPRKSDLKRGRFVDKNKEPATRQSNLKRNDSLTKKEKQSANTRKKEEKENNINKDNSEGGGGSGINRGNVANAKILKTLANQRKLKRRHTVGGTKDFGDWEKIVRHGDTDPVAAVATAAEDEEEEEGEQRENAKEHDDVRSAWKRLEPVIDDPFLNADRSLDTWMKRQQERVVRASSPDLIGAASSPASASSSASTSATAMASSLTPDSRRFSLPDSVMADNSVLMPSLLESQV